MPNNRETNTSIRIAQELDEQLIEEVLGHLRTATDTASGWAKSWHHWGLFNLALLGHHAANREPAKAQQHVAPAVVGFFRSVALGQMEGRFLLVSRDNSGVSGFAGNRPGGGVMCLVACAVCFHPCNLRRRGCLAVVTVLAPAHWAQPAQQPAPFDTSYAWRHHCQQ